MTLAGAREQAPSLKPVAEGLGLSLPSASRAVDGLVKRSLVARTEDPDDRRQRLLALTDDGQELADRIMPRGWRGSGSSPPRSATRSGGASTEALELLLDREEIADIYRQYRRHADR